MSIPNVNKIHHVLAYAGVKVDIVKDQYLLSSWVRYYLCEIVCIIYHYQIGRSTICEALKKFGCSIYHDLLMLQQMTK